MYGRWLYYGSVYVGIMPLNTKGFKDTASHDFMFRASQASANTLPNTMKSIVLLSHYVRVSLCLFFLSCIGETRWKLMGIRWWVCLRPCPCPCSVTAVVTCYPVCYMVTGEVLWGLLFRRYGRSIKILAKASSTELMPNLTYQRYEGGPKIQI